MSFPPLSQTPKAYEKESYRLHLPYQGESPSEGRSSCASPDDSQEGYQSSKKWEFSWARDKHNGHPLHLN